ncbi:hypothetical protein [Halococcus saccharolyticus]|uniref:DNA polymerase sliding clamp n=1 Tax=Halococcus saccharolyticus DSM 5350 TaxID=1227455 RepID=M0MDB1_9EURY|nr:hypothetical protein [Halococcus saccharolyticus]EMA42639.1 DNA polymerase sliding clamp [Halococcus saccharolyticus DSM 5350]
MTDLDASYCPACGNILAAAEAIHADDGTPFSPDACGEYERDDGHAVVRPQEVRIYVHGDHDDGNEEEAMTDGGQPIQDLGDIDDPDEYKCEFCEVTRPEAHPLKTHLIAEHAKQIASRHWAEHVDIGVLMTDGGKSRMSETSDEDPRDDVDRENESEPEGAIDNTFDDAVRDARETLATNAADHYRELEAGDVAIDLVTRQPLFVTSVAAPSLPAYYEDEGFDLLNYKAHPYLPVRMDDRVLNCVFVPRAVEGVHNTGKEYAYPAGRLARVPIERAVGDGDSS